MSELKNLQLGLKYTTALNQVKNRKTLLKDHHVGSLKASVKEFGEDNGSATWGEIIYLKRIPGDQVLISEVIIPTLSNEDQRWRWYTNFNKNDTNIQVTTVRMLNLGRERAVGTTINISATEVELYFAVSALKQPRLLVEIYGKEVIDEDEN